MIQEEAKILGLLPNSLAPSLEPNSIHLGHETSDPSLAHAENILYPALYPASITEPAMRYINFPHPKKSSTKLRKNHKSKERNPKLKSGGS